MAYDIAGMLHYLRERQVSAMESFSRSTPQKEPQKEFGAALDNARDKTAPVVPGRPASLEQARTAPLEQSRPGAANEVRMRVDLSARHPDAASAEQTPARRVYHRPATTAAKPAAESATPGTPAASKNQISSTRPGTPVAPSTPSTSSTATTPSTPSTSSASATPVVPSTPGTSVAADAAKPASFMRVRMDRPHQTPHDAPAKAGQMTAAEETRLLSMARTEDQAKALLDAKRIRAAYLKAAESKPERIAGLDPLQNAAPAERLLATAGSLLGRPYQVGGESPRSGFDCSGFTSYVFGKQGVELPRSSREQFGEGREVAQNDLQRGDLVFFGSKKHISHVGIYAGEGKFIHSASESGRVRVSELDDPYWQGRLVGCRRLL